MMISVIGSIAVNTGLIFVNHPWAYTMIRLMAGAFAHGGVVVGYVYVMEFVGPDSRAWACSHYLNIFSVRFPNPCSIVVAHDEHRFLNLFQLDSHFGHLWRIFLEIGTICKSGLFVSVCHI